MTAEDFLQAGMQAVKSGEREKAAALFAQAVRADPQSVDGWYWLGVCSFEPERREYCFRRVLSLDPDHIKARDQLARGSAPATPKGPSPFLPESAPTPRPASEKVASVPRPIPPPVAPFVAAVEPAAPPAPAPPPPEPEPETPPAFGSEQKRANPFLIALAIIIPALLCCSLAGVYAWRTNSLPPQLAALLTPSPLPTVASFEPTATPTSTPGVPTAIPTARPTVAYTPQYESADCRFDVPEDADVECGYLIVPEDRAGDPSHTIRLSVALYHSESSNPRPEPVVFLQGGPGGEAVQLSALAYDLLVKPFLADRDFITFDQRGTGLSQPALKCDELTRTFLQDIHGLIAGDTRDLVYSNAFLSCNGLMSSQGVQLNAYTTVASAADLKDLLAALGYERADLYGASYGTRLALVTMRDYPEIVHTAVLDSVVPVEANLFDQYPEMVEYSLGTLFEDCAADPECNAAYPDLETVFWEIVAQLNDQPVSVTTSSAATGTITETMDGATFMSVILGSLRYPDLIPTAPQSIYRFRGGDYSTLIAAQASLPFTFEGISPGLYISMMCNEHILATTTERLQAINAARQDIQNYAWLPFYGTAQDLFDTCQDWGAIGPRLGENEATFSDIPTLIITGRYDPATPPLFGRQIAGHLSRSYYFEFPNQGHTPTAADASGCAMDTVVAFLDRPDVEPDRGCLDALARPRFLVPYTGNPPLALRTTRIAGVSVNVPQGWSDDFVAEGIYLRANSPLDITQINIRTADVSADELQELLSLSAYGHAGLDGAPTEAGARSAHGLQWVLYTATSDGRPVDIAMADTGGSSVLLLMFSNEDEHKALYQTVFLPLVDSAQP